MKIIYTHVMEFSFSPNLGVLFSSLSMQAGTNHFSRVEY